MLHRDSPGSCPVVLGLLLALAAAAGVANGGAAAAGEYPALPPPSAPEAHGLGFQRSMRLLAGSRPDRRHRVRILYYGQSIVGQRWSEEVDADLRRRFPHAEIVSRNLAIGGFSSQRLVRTMHYDVFPFYPDLIVFHVYGSHIDYEKIVRAFRERTTADVILQTDHANRWPEARADALEKQVSWDGKMNHWFLPGFAKKYRCALQPQREEWVAYLRAHGLEPAALLRDTVHLNPHGKWLMARLLERFLVHRPDVEEIDWPDRVRTLVVGEDVHWKGDRLVVEFEGNRVVALAGAGARGRARVLVDGRPPSAFPECHAVTRPSGTAGVGWPAVMRIGWNVLPIVEEWTATVRGFDAEQKDFELSVRGSVTGPDGEGRGGERFVSRSGRVVIEPEDWVFSYCHQVSKKATPDGWQVRWRVVPLYTEEYAPEPATDPARDEETVLVSGLASGRHRLELVAREGRRPPLRALRIHRPPLGRVEAPLE